VESLIGVNDLLKDIQSQIDNRGISLNRVGIKNIDWPLKVYDRAKEFQNTVATISLSVSLKHNVKGTHMSRFIEVLNNIDILNPHVILNILETIQTKLDADSSFFECSFPYFIWKKSPVSNHTSPLKIEATIMSEKHQSKNEITIGVVVPVQTLCPCSKAISSFGAHNQRANVKILVKTKRKIWFEHLAEIAEKSASSPVYSLLKREDEKYVTEAAYNSPKFVEDVARDTALLLEKEEGLTWYKVEVESFESIHNHEAFAWVEKDL
jgi:GTP cyclohydrolase I